MATHLERQNLVIRVLEVLNIADGAVDTIKALQELLKDALGFDAVGIRLRQNNDFPFHSASGYSAKFLESERMLCAQGEDGGPVTDASGNVLLECVCGAVLQGRLAPEASFCSPGGSFWVNRSSRVATETPPGHLPARARFTCVHEGYETMAMIPLRSAGETVGLLQLNDRAPDLLDAEFIEFLEGLGNSIGVGLAKERAREELAASHEAVRQARDSHQSTLDMLGIGVVRLDSGGRIQFLNRVAEHFALAPRETLRGRSYRELPFVDDALERHISRHLDGVTGGDERVTIETVGPGRQRYRLNLEVRGDPEASDQTLLFLYDVTEVAELRRLLDDQGAFHDLVGQSEPMTTLFRRIREVASVDFTVLVEGETGTGKELVARAIHDVSARRKGPFVAVNCAGLSETLLASQLFGHRRGAFTGAVADHQGYFEAADGGTLFLDEIGDISPGLQATLLRVLEEKVVTRVGDTRERKVDVRIVTATHHDLASDAKAGRFRPDLLYRLRVARLVLPRLAERREDIPLLVGHFLRRVRAITGKDVAEVAAPAMRLLLHHGWPGNVRELKAAIEYATLHAAGPRIMAEDLPPELRDTQAYTTDYAPRSDLVPVTAYESPEDEREAILEALRATEGNRSRAAKRLGVSRATFYRRLTEFGLV